MVKGLADMIRTASTAVASGKNPLGQFDDAAAANAQLLGKAKQSLDQGHYADAAAHFINYLIPGGSAFEDIQNDIRDGNYGHAAAKFGGLASTVVAGAKAPAVLDAATEPGAIPAVVKPVVDAVTRGAPDIVKGTAKLGAGMVVGGAIPGGGMVTRLLLDYPGGRQIVSGVGKMFEGKAAAPLADRVAAAASTATAEAADPLANGIAQSLGHENFAAAPAPAQETVRNLVNAIRTAPEMTPEQVAAFTREEPSAGASTRPSSIPANSLPDYGPLMDAASRPSWEPGPPGTPAPPERWEPAPQTQTAPAAPATQAKPATLIPVAPLRRTTAGTEVPPDLARQLADEMLKQGTITAEHLKPPVIEPGGSVTAEGQSALADTMRELPPGSRVPVAKATYAGGAVDDSELAGAVYEAAHRAERAEKLANILIQHGVTAGDVPNISPEHWEALSKSIGINPPSTKTIAEVGARLTQRENHIALQDAVDRLGKSLAAANGK